VRRGNTLRKTGKQKYKIAKDIWSKSLPLTAGGFWLLTIGGVLVSKPSIFSKDYQKRMRRRRKRTALLIVAAVIVAAAAFLAGKNFLSNGSQQQSNGTATVEDKKEVDSKTATDKTETDKTATETKEADTPVEEGFEFKLADGTAMKAVYTTTGTVKKFESVSPKEKNVYFNINPTGDKIVVFDSAAQSIMLIDAAGKVQDITNPSYTSSKGTVFKKENVLSQYSGYVWCSSPAFISDTKVAYITQLPYFGATSKYVWTVDLTTSKHSTVSSVKGEKITFGKLEAKGLTMDVDGSVFYITPAGSAVR
jgi:hypothetical protein